MWRGITTYHRRDKGIEADPEKGPFSPSSFHQGDSTVDAPSWSSMQDIEASLSIDDNTIRRYVKAFKEKGLKRYMQDGFVPYSGKLTEEE